MNKHQVVIDKIIQSVSEINIEKISLLSSIHRILQENIIADINMPPFNKSAMDGFACRIEDLNNELTILETIQAGRLPSKEIHENECSRIMTGAAVPEGADCVFMLEDSSLLGDKKVKCTNPNSKPNICYKAEDYKKGEILIKAGIKISPSHIGTIAGAGYSELLVSKRPRIGIIATGTELVEPYETPIDGQIRNSNSYQIMAQLQTLGLEYNYIGTIIDDFELISTSFEKSLMDNDVIIITGGASNGDFDFIPAILKKHNFELIVDQTGIQPGNPMTFSKKLNKYCFGLSGNPVSSFVQFELFVKPFLNKFMNGEINNYVIKGILAQDFNRKKANRFGIIPVQFTENNSVEDIGFHGSAHINALAYANALMEIPEKITFIPKGEIVNIRLI